MRKIFLLLCFCFSNASVTHDWGEVLKIFSKRNFQEFLGDFKDEVSSEKCRNDTNLFQQGLANPVTSLNDGFWHLKMLDANGEIPSGIFAGNLYSLGNVDSCLEVNFDPDITNPDDGFRGKYFPIYLFAFDSPNKNITKKTFSPFQGPLELNSKRFLKQGMNHEKSMSSTGQPFPIRLSLCLPSSCTDDDVRQGVQSIVDFGLQNLSLSISVMVLTGTSQSRDIMWNFDGIDIFAIVVVSLIGLLVLIGSALEAWTIYSPEWPNLKTSLSAKFLLGFGVYRNTQVLLKTTSKEVKERSEYIYCLNGIRFISMTWVLMGHVFMNYTSSPSNNAFIYLAKLSGTYAFQVVMNAFPSVDTFFLISGCLVTYLTLKDLDKSKGRVNWIMFIIHRYLRLTGVYAFLILVHSSLIRVFEGGPYDMLLMQIDTCRETWWHHLLYITNFMTSFEQEIPIGNAAVSCIAQTWYLDNDMQMFLVSPFIIYPLWKWKIPGLIWGSLWMLASCVVPLVLTFVKDWPATMSVDMGGSLDYFTDNYIVPWCRFSPYICGILLGYALHITKNKKFKMRVELNVLMWIAAFVTGYMVVYGLNLPDVIIDMQPLSKTENAIYGGFHRLAWGLAVSWVIFACARGYGGWVNTFLSWEGFEPLARLSYIIYMVHMTIMYILAAKDDFVPSLSHYIVILRILTVTVFSTLISAVLFVCVEVPWANTEKLLFSIILPAQKKNKET